MQKSEKFKVSICYKKTHFGPLSVQKPQCKIFPENIIRVNFKALCCCNFMQKIEKFHVLTIVVTWKTSFWALFGPLLTQKIQNIVISKKSFPPLLSIYAAATSEKFHALAFDNTWKISFWGLFCPKTSKQSYSQQNHLCRF